MVEEPSSGDAPAGAQPDAGAAALRVAREHTHELLGALDDELLRRAPAPIMSPLVWDLAHIGNYEELWILQRLAGLAPTNELYDDMYDAFRHERFVRDELPLLSATQARDYVAAVRDRSLSVLDDLERSLDPGREPLLRDGFVLGLVAQHEHQHDETILQSRQLLGARVPPLTRAGRTGPSTRSEAEDGAEVLVSPGRMRIGTSAEPWAYDNERPAHEVRVADFWIDVHPVSNRRFLEFVERGGYDQRGSWSEAGWAWRCESGARAPQYWERDATGSWLVERFGELRALDPDEPVQHVSWFEADAFARWSGRRLPTEVEWEAAARWQPDGGPAGRWPWGDAQATTDRANLGRAYDGPAPIGSLPGGASACGCQQLVGDVWEWTSTEFDGYPGFHAWPYREYSEVFFRRGYRVLRGGSWATHPAAIRTTFRNWDLPQRRQLFAGFRTARSQA